MNRPTRPLAIFLAALVLSVAAHGVGRAQETKLTVMVFRGGQNLPLFAAQEQGFLAKRGIAVNVLFAPSADELPRVLADGRVQIIHSTSDNVVKILEIDKLDVALIVGGDNAHNHIIAQQDIARLEDLRGQTIVLDTSTSIQAVKAGLKDMGSTVSMMGPYQGPAGYTLRSWAKANEDTLVKY